MTRSFFFSGNRQFFAPRVLTSILNVPLPKDLAAKANYRYKRLSDLDKDSIKYFGYSSLECLFNLMASRIQKIAFRKQSEIINIYVGSIPRGLKLEDLNLRIRTYNCLQAGGLEKSPEKLASLTIKDVLMLRNFGARSLLDLLMAIETLAPESVIIENLSGPSSLMEDRDWLIEANKLTKTEYSEIIQSGDFRLGHLIKGICNKPLKGKRENSCNIKEIAEILIQGVYRPSDPGQLSILIGELRSAIKKKARMTLKEELEDFLLFSNSRRNKAIIARRLGWDGCGGRTLQEVGNEFGLTRERVRQVETNFVCLVQRTKLSSFAPALDRSLAVITAIIPKSDEKINMALREEGIITEYFDLKGLITAAKILKREVPFVLKTSRRIRLAIPLNFSEDVVLKVAKSAIRYWGVSTIADTTVRASEVKGEMVDSSHVIDTLKLIDGFEWLDQERGWFWISSIHKNRLINQIEKVLSIAPDIHVNELREGVRRPYFLKGFAPPRKVLLEVCSRISGCSVEDDRVTADPAPAREDVLGNSEAIMAQCLLQNGPLIIKNDFEKLCTSMGMTRSNFYRNLSYSPIIIRHATSVYGLRGEKIDPGLAEDLTKDARHKVLRDHGWTNNGDAWIGYILSAPTIHNGMVTIPSSLENVIKGTFRLTSEEGESITELVARDNLVRGLSIYFQRRGGEAGDALILVFNLKTSLVTAQLGDYSLLERASSGELWQVD